MPVGDLKVIIGSRPEDARLLGLDIGSKTIGLALSDSGHSVATPLRTINRKKFAQDMESLAEVIRDYETGGFVLGYPVNMDGSKGPRCDAVLSFADEMRNYPQIVGTDPWIALWDERLSTVSVEGFVGEFVNINKAKQKGVIDKLAAQHILQGALDFIQATKF